MKTVLTLSLLFVLALTKAQTSRELPSKEFAIALSENSLSIKPGEQKQIIVSVLRSKSYARSSAAMGFSNSLPAGVSAVYEPATGNFETTVVTISAAPSAVTGTYQIVLNGTINHKTKGSILKLSVGNEPVASK